MFIRIYSNLFNYSSYGISFYIFMTPFHVACFQRNKTIIDLLLEAPGINFSLKDSQDVLFKNLKNSYDVLER